MNCRLALQRRRPPDDSEAAPSSTGPSEHDLGGFETALRAASELAVVWAFGLALLLILAHRI